MNKKLFLLAVNISLIYMITNELELKYNLVPKKKSIELKYIFMVHALKYILLGLWKEFFSIILIIDVKYSPFLLILIYIVLHLFLNISTLTKIKFVPKYKPHFNFLDTFLITFPNIPFFHWNNKSQLQIHLFTGDNLVIVISKEYTLIILSTFLNMR
jgi:hypothetical protein